MTQQEFEDALDTGKLWMRRTKNKWYKVVRSGRTQHGLNGEFSVSCKVANNKYLAITGQDLKKEPCDLRIKS